ncbi:hypothetical protein GCM10009069_09490 [Algimonas arctica]|uniref:Uncharacterized protein n=1 Tax=Algimonas arctica TaxID=1479486 RepID=A0A8J3CNE7_9PROT|nr:type I restriction endonuclease subunit M [Algimonas arctica]GHA88616.1 hypothetical protein GCM10009069_09490 [Algimonas arctica]
MFEQTFKNLDDIMFQEPGCNSELDYAEQSPWLLFLKYLDDFEAARAIEAKISGQNHTPIFKNEYRWSSCAKPARGDGSHDNEAALIGSDLIDCPTT